MSVLKYTTFVLTLACCNFAFAQQTTTPAQTQAQSQQAQSQDDQSRRADRVEDRRDQFGENRDERQDTRNARQENRDDRQSNRSADGRQLGERVGAVLNTALGDSMDEYIATTLLIGNQEEVALAQEAASRAENENVKQFAKMLIADHQQAIQKLQQHAKQGMSLDGSADISVSVNSQGGQSNPAQSSQANSAQVKINQPSGAQSDQIAANDSPSARQYTANRVDIDSNLAGGGSMDKVLKLQQQAAQECLSMTKSLMAEKQGAEFDMAFAGSQIGAHIGMLAKLKASQQHASPELASILQESEQAAQKHLEEAKQLCKELESMQASNR